MSAATIGLVGVVIGAVFGGAAQILNEGLRERRARRIRIYTEMRAAYQLLLAADARVLALRVIEDVGERMDTMSAFHTALARVALIAPDDTFTTGQLLFDAAVDLNTAKRDSEERNTGASSNTAAVALRKRRAEFLTVAKRDLANASA